MSGYPIGLITNYRAGKISRQMFIKQFNDWQKSRGINYDCKGTGGKDWLGLTYRGRHAVIKGGVIVWTDDDIDPCTAEERWADGDKYAVMKNGRKTAVRVFDTQADADACAGELGNSHYVEHRPANATIPLFFFRKLCYIISMTATKLSTAANILKNAGCTDIYLFGSQARGVANENSDIDLGVKGLPPSMFFRVHLQLENALDMKVDLVDFDYQKSFFNLLRDIGELKQIG